MSDQPANAQRSFIEVKNDVIEAMKSVFDPEIPVNIYELGLLYEVNVDPLNNVHILMTLTAPNCPAAQTLPKEVEQRAREVEGASHVRVEITFDPPWDQEMMSEAAKLELGFL
jgi:FeS assembly SUF system protein